MGSNNRVTLYIYIMLIVGVDIKHVSFVFKMYVHIFSIDFLRVYTQWKNVSISSVISLVKSRHAK